MKGSVYTLKADLRARGHEQRGERFAVVVQATGLGHLSTWLVVPTSTSAQPTTFRPPVEVPGRGMTLALCDAVRAVDPAARLGEHLGLLSLSEVAEIDLSLMDLLDLD